MSRYLVLYAYFLRFSFSKAMEFRVDFFFRVGMDALFYATHLAFFWVIYQHTPSVGGWNLDQTLVFAAGIFVADALHMTFLSNNMWLFPFLVNKGDLDYYLVRPVSTLFFVSLREFAANSFLNLLLAVAILLWALGRYPEALGAGQVTLYICLVMLGSFINYTISFLFVVPVFWLHNAAGLRDTYFGLSRFSGRPDGIYKGWVRRILTSILPFALITSFPTRALFQADGLSIAVHMLIVAAVTFGLLLFLWHRGLRSYASASS
ncbi:MAG: ABC-2 family transporter protein [Planctomycetota bacterium]|nr:ABC-2 family transporter protein [Planctomycetota bacterium]